MSTDTEQVDEHVAGGQIPKRRIGHEILDLLSGLPLFATAPLYRHWHVRWGATDNEVQGSMPGDEIISRPSLSATRAITIGAPPERVWPWIVQMGYRRAGFYTYDLIDNDGYPSADRVLEEYQHIEVGGCLITIVGLVSSKSPQEPIQDPFFFLMEVLIVITAPLYVAVMVAVHASAEPSVKAYSLMALTFMIVCAAITTSVHFVLLTVSRQIAFTSVSWMPLFLSFKWPSVIYALDILAWDWFYGLSLLFAALVFKGDRLQRALRIALAVSGGLSLAGLIFLPFGDIQLRLIGILGYAGLGPVVYLLVAIVFGRAESRSQEAARSRGPELGLRNGREDPQEVFKEKHTV